MGELDQYHLQMAKQDSCKLLLQLLLLLIAGGKVKSQFIDISFIQFKFALIRFWLHINQKQIRNLLYYQQDQLYRETLLIKMNKRLQTIQNMKEKLYKIQGQLNNISPKEHLIFYSKEHLCRKQQLSSSLQYKNPTYWGGNPILGTSTKYRRTPDKPIAKHNQRQNKSHKQLSSQIKAIMQDTSNRYFRPKPQRSSTRSFSSQSKYCISKRPANGLKTPRFTKVKTYPQQERNPIINPGKPSPKGKKIWPAKQKSPENFYTQNPRSSPLIFFNNTQPIYLSPLKNIINMKNDSSNIDSILNSSDENMNATAPIHKKKLSKGKKHFLRYFYEDLGYR